MTTTLCQISLPRVVDNSGDPIDGAKLYVWLTGATSNAVYYLNADGTSPGPHPLVSNADGQFQNIYLDPATVYRIKCTNATGSAILYDADPVPGAPITTAEIDAIIAAAAAASAASAAAAAASASAAALASAIAGAYPNAAKDHVPQGLTQASVGAITPGSGGTNGTFALAWSGGNFTSNPTGTFTVAGAVLTAVTITGPGLYIGGSPSVPTPSFAASSGLTAAAVALTIQYLVPSGEGYWVQSTNGTELDAYHNDSGTATATTGVGPIPTTTPPPPNTYTGSQTLALVDARVAAVEMNSAAGNNLTVPPNSDVAFPIGTRITVAQIGVGQTQIVEGAGVTVHAENGYTALSGQYAVAELYKRATNEWVLSGDITVPPLLVALAQGADMALLGQWNDASGGGHNYAQAVAGPNSWVEFEMVGTKLEIQALGGSGQEFSLIVDGGSPTTKIVPSGWNWSTLVQDLSDDTHRIKITSTGGDSPSNAVDTDEAFKISGASPAISRPTDIPNYFILGDTEFLAKGIADGSPTLNPGLFGSTFKQREWRLGAAVGLRFKATTTSVRLFTYGEGQRIVLTQDGSDIADVHASSSPPYGICTVATGLSGSHDYEIQFCDAGIQNLAFGLLVDTLQDGSYSDLRTIAYYGDSTAAQDSTAIGGPGNDARLVEGTDLAALIGDCANNRNGGQDGALVVNQLRDNTALVTGVAGPVPTDVFVQAGVNDATHAVDLDTFQASYQTMLENIRTGLPSAKIWARGMFNVSAAQPAYPVRSAYNARIALAVAAISDVNIVYVDTDGWIDPTTDTPDGLHPNVAGMAKCAAAQYALM